MNIFIAEIKRLLNKTSIRSLLEKMEPTFILILDREFENAEGFDAFEQADRIAKFIFVEEHFFSTFEEGKLILEMANKHLNFIPLFPEEKTEEKMSLVPNPLPYDNNLRKVMREIVSKTKVTKSDAATIAKILSEFNLTHYLM